MNRREFLGSAVGTVAVSLGGVRVLSGPGPYRPLGSVSVANAMDAVVDGSGETAYVAATDGFATVDVSNPAEPTVLAERRDLLADREDGPMEAIWDLAVDDDRLAVAGPANPGGGTPVQGFLLFDVSDPARPRQVALHETDFPIHNLFVADGRAYLTGLGDANPLVIVDVTGNEPQEVGRWSLFDVSREWKAVDPELRWLHDVWVQGDVAFLAQWDAGTYLVDVGDPSNPAHIGTVGGRSADELASVSNVHEASLELPGNHHYAAANDDSTVLGVNKEAWAIDPEDTAAAPGGLELWDITDPSKPTVLSAIEPPPTPDPTYFGASIAGFGSSGGSEFGHLDCHRCSEGGDAVWTTSHNFDIAGDRLFSSWYQGGVKIHDISDPANPELLAWWRDPETKSFWTAQLATSSFFVASTFGTDFGDGDGGLYTFPNEPGEQQDPPALDSASNGTREGTRNR